MTPALYLIPCPIGATPTEQVLPAYNKEVILSIRHFIVEEIRTARRFLKSVDRSIDIDALTFHAMGKHADQALFASYLEPLRRGESVGIISEAGCPAVADPGADIVAIAQREGMRVIPLVGPSSILMALMASGLNGQSFAFNGYLPIDPTQRIRRLKQLEARAQTEHQPQIFIETPYRNHKMLSDIIAACRPGTRLCIAAAISTEQEYIRTQTIANWKKHPAPNLAKLPTIFIVG